MHCLINGKMCSTDDVVWWGGGMRWCGGEVAGGAANKMSTDMSVTDGTAIAGTKHPHKAINVYSC